MMRWEYRKIDLNDVPRRVDDIDVLIDAGKDGWELVGVTTNNSRRRAASSRTSEA